ncbi:hypothetical protein ACJJTC_011322, partial [Scirpophaga incertulas]
IINRGRTLIRQINAREQGKKFFFVSVCVSLFMCLPPLLWWQTSVWCFDISHHLCLIFCSFYLSKHSTVQYFVYFFAIMVNCCVIGCKSRSERKEPNITFHRFPNQPTLRNKWTECTGRVQWHPSQHSRICSRHFESRCFQLKKKGTFLRQSVIPTLFLHEIISQHDQPGSSKQPLKMEIQAFESLPDDASLSDDLSILPPEVALERENTKRDAAFLTDDMSILRPKVAMETEIEKTVTPEITPRKIKLMKKLEKSTALGENRKKKLAALRSKTWRLQKKTAEMSTVIQELKTRSLINQESADLLSSIDVVNRDFLKKFLCKDSTARKYTPELRKFALTLHYISPKAYNFVRKQFNTCLPHTRTLSRWYQCIDGNPGFSSESIKAVKILHDINKNKNPLHKTLCALSFDEMAIRKGVYFDGNNCIGFVNFGNEVESDSDQLAKDALVFMLTCINGSWKIPLGYFLINGISAEQKASLVKICIETLSQDCGVDILSLTFDGCATNLSMAKILGCKLESIDSMNPTFTVGNDKIVIFPDPSHMLKLIRNTLGEKGPILDPQGRVISWDYVKSLVELQDNEGLHLGNKLNKSHINFVKQIMKVKLAAQVMSESVANAIEFCDTELKISDFKNSEGTVDFIRKINNLFDVLNSRNLKSYTYKKPLYQKNFPEIKKIFGRHGCIFNELKIRGAIRAKGGFNNNPSAQQFKSAFKRMLVHGEIKHITSGNCIPLEHMNILTLTNPELAINKTSEKSRLIDNDTVNTEVFEKILMKDHDYLSDPSILTEFSKHIIIYIAGFIVSKLKKELHCEECISVIICNTKYVSLQLKKDRGGLCYPAVDVIKICEICEIIFRRNKGFFRKDLLIELMQASLQYCLGYPFFSKVLHFKEQTFLDCHYSLLVKAIILKYLKVRIHYATKKLSEKSDTVRNFYNKLILFKGQ